MRSRREYLTPSDNIPNFRCFFYTRNCWKKSSLTEGFAVRFNDNLRVAYFWPPCTCIYKEYSTKSCSSCRETTC